MNGILAANEAAGPAGLGSIFVMYAVVIGVFWFFLMRPQKKEQKRVQGMLATMEIGDTVLTGDIIGTVGRTAIAESEEASHIHLSMTKDGVSVDPLEHLPQN